MADYNDVPLGQAGTGAAFILPQSQAANVFMSELDKNRQIDAQNALIKQKYAQQLANSFRENQLKIKGGINWQPEIQQRAKAITDMGNKLFQAGVNPYSYDHSDPTTSKAVDAFNIQRQQLLQDVDTRDAYQKQLDEDDKQLALHGAGSFEPDYLQQRQQFLNTPLSQIAQGNQQLPTLAKAFNYNDLLTKLKEVPIERKYTDRNNIEHTIRLPNEVAHRAQVTAAIQNDPSAQRQYQRVVGMPLDQVATTTNFDKERDFNTDYYRNTPEGQKELLDNGITSYTSDKFKKFVDDQTQQSIDAKKRGDAFINRGVDFLNGQVTQKNESKFNDDYLRYQLALRAEQRDKERLNMARKKDTPTETLVIGNQGSNVPVIKVNTKNGTVGTKSSTEAERGASLFSTNFDNQTVTVTPDVVVNLSDGHSRKNTESFNMDVGTVKMVPVFKGLDTKDSRNGAEMSLRQLREIISGKSKVGKLENIEFRPYAYGQRTVREPKYKDENGVKIPDGDHIVHRSIAIPYDAIKGNKKIPTQQFDKTQSDFEQLIQSPDFKSLSQKEKLDFLQETFNIKD